MGRETSEQDGVLDGAGELSVIGWVVWKLDSRGTSTGDFLDLNKKNSPPAIMITTKIKKSG